MTIHESESVRRVAVVIEDDADIRHLVETVLTQGGFQVISAGNGLDGIEAVRRYEPIVTTLDVNMPGMDGFETARRIRAFSSTYIVMLTALGEEIDAVQGLDAGADDFVNKPFRPRELRARIEAMLRRPRSVPTDSPSPEPTSPLIVPIAEPVSVSAQHAEPEVTAPQPAPVVAPAVSAESRTHHHDAGEGWLSHNGLDLDPTTRVAQNVAGELDLTRSEFDLLAALMQSQRRVRTKADLVLLLRGESYVTSHFVSDQDKRAVEVHMANLRKKLGENPSMPRWIETVRGVGYRLTAPD